MKKQFPKVIWVWVSHDEDTEFLIPCRSPEELPDDDCEIAKYCLEEIGQLQISKNIVFPKTKK